MCRSSNRSRGPLFPISHTRTYLQRSEAGDEYPATVLVGGQADFKYDAFAELKFKDGAALEHFSVWSARARTRQKSPPTRRCSWIGGR